MNIEMKTKRKHYRMRHHSTILFNINSSTVIILICEPYSRKDKSLKIEIGGVIANETFRETNLPSGNPNPSHRHIHKYLNNTNY